MNWKNTRLMMMLVALLMGLFGLWLIAEFDGWIESLGVFTCFYAHNIEKHTRDIEYES